MDINLRDKVIFTTELGIRVLTTIVAVDSDDGTVAIPSVCDGVTPNDMGYMVEQDEFIALAGIKYFWTTRDRIEIFEFDTDQTYDISFDKIFLDNFKDIV